MAGVSIGLLTLAARAEAPPAPTNGETTVREPYRSPLENLVAAERAFAASSPKVGIKAAFLEVLAPDSILFHPDMVNGREWREKQPDLPGAQLTWYPSVAFLSESCDLGFTTGPFEFRAADAEQTGRIGYGHYVSLWRRERQAPHRWQLLCDLGVSHPKLEQRPPAWLRPFDDHSDRDAAKSAEPLMSPMLLVAGLHELLEQFDSAPEGVEPLRVLRRDHSAADVRFYRPGRAPIIGRDAVVADEAIAGELLRAGLKKTFVSDAGDFAATISTGTLARPANGGVESRSANVVRFWHRPSGREWLLLLEVMNLTPPKPAAGG